MIYEINKKNILAIQSNMKLLIKCTFTLFNVIIIAIERNNIQNRSVLIKIFILCESPHNQCHILTISQRYIILTKKINKNSKIISKYISAVTKDNEHCNQQKNRKIERVCCFVQFRFIERPWMRISVDRPLWEGSKLVYRSP